MQDDFLSRCVVDPVARKFYLYSEQGDERVVDCETMEQFMGRPWERIAMVKLIWHIVSMGRMIILM